MLQENLKNDIFLNIGYLKLLIITMDNTGVKIDKDLLNRVEKIIKEKDKKIVYSSRKQFINIAVLKLLKREENEK